LALISLSSQPDHDGPKSIVRNDNDEIQRKPLKWAKLAKRAKEAFNHSNLRYRFWHCCRHTQSIFIHGKTGDKELTMQWLGILPEKFYLHKTPSIEFSKCK
jgi:hypothetical protein